jgi:eukaryotic-like serine/threonine-protein kinase
MSTEQRTCPSCGNELSEAMEFCPVCMLESLIKRSGRLEAKLALEIVTQVATGLAAVHKKGLVHRDIKPSNIMVSLEEGGASLSFDRPPH